MGYAGYSPGNNSRQADELTPLQRALRALPLSRWQESLKAIEDITRNVVRNPCEEQLRRVDLSEPTLAAAIAEVPCAVGILKEMGWVESRDGLVLPLEVRLTHQRDVVGIIEAKDYYKTEAEEERKRQMRARKSGAAARAGRAFNLGGGPRHDAISPFEGGAAARARVPGCGCQAVRPQPRRALGEAAQGAPRTARPGSCGLHREG